MIKNIKTKNAPSAPGLLSQAIEADGFVFVSGQIHKLADGGLVGETILDAAKLDFDHVVKVTVFLTDISEYSNFNGVYTSYFKKPYPAREVVCVKELPLGADIEISLIAKK